jgi:hypothetical protein
VLCLADYGRRVRDPQKLAGNIGSASAQPEIDLPIRNKPLSFGCPSTRPGDRRKLRASRHASHSISEAALGMRMVMLPHGYKSSLPLRRSATPS